MSKTTPAANSGAAGPLATFVRPATLGPVVIAVMDGIGVGPDDAGNAVLRAHAPFLRFLPKLPHYGTLLAHGPSVGLSANTDMGNSEVGHNALGSGQIVRQGASRVADAVADGSLCTGATFQATLAHLRSTGGALHLLGLLSDGNVHSHIDHALALVRAADAHGVSECVLHILLDGRDVARQSASLYVNTLEALLAVINAKPARRYRIGSGGGRMRMTMDRYGADWPMVERGWRAHVHGEGPPAQSATDAINRARALEPQIGDQELPPFVVCDTDGPVGRMHDGDAVIAFNFRGDRMLQLTEAFEADTFAAFSRDGEARARPQVLFVGMMQYDGDALRPAKFLVEPPCIRNTLGERLAASQVAQLAVSETQKFGHVTYFWNGNRTGSFCAALEDAIEVPSLRVPFVQQPAMQAQAIVTATIEALRKRAYGVGRINFPNGDMVGHTGDFAATVQAAEAVDAALALLAKTVVAELGGALIVTGDHGNAEDMFERDKHGDVLCDASGVPQAKTSHSIHPVPFGLLLPARVAPKLQVEPCLHSGQAGLANVAATVATLCGFAPDPAWEPSLVAWRS